MILAGLAAAGLGATLTWASAAADASSRRLRVEFRTDKSALWKVYGTAHVDLTTDSSFYREAAGRSPDARIVLSFTPAYASPVSSCLEAAAAEGDKNGSGAVDGVWRRCLETAVPPAAQPTQSDAAAAEAPTLAEFRISEEIGAARPTGDAAPPPALPHQLHTTVKVGSALTREKLMVGPNGGGPGAAGTFLQEVFTIDLGLRGVPIALSYQLRAVAKPTSGEISATAFKLGFPQLAPRPLLANEETVEEMTNPANQKTQTPVEAPAEKSFFTKYWWAILLAIMAANFLTQEAPQAAQPDEPARSPAAPTACQNQQPSHGSGGPRQRAPGAPRSR